MSTAPPTAEELKAQKVYQATNVTLDRTTSGIIRGAINTPIKQLKPEQRLLLEKARVRDQFSKGKISADQALNRLGISAIQFEKEAHERTIRWGQQAQRAGKSEKVKQDTIREKAAQQGVAVGTISSNGTAPVSNQSRIANNATVSNFAKAQTVTQAQREARVKVTTPDGKERTFKNRETAEEFVSRTEGSYVKEKQGPVKTNRSFEVTLTEGKKEESVKGPYGSLQYNYGQQYEHPLGSVFESSLKSLDEFQLYKPEDPTLSALKTIVDPVAGLTKASLATFASLGNLGIQAGAYVKGREQSITKPIAVPQTLVGNFIGGVIEGKSQDKQFKDAYGYITTRGIPTSAGELGEIGLGGAGGVKAAAKLIPIRANKYSQPGVKILANTKTVSKAPIKPQLVEVQPKSISIGYGSKTKPIISKVGDKITLGGPDLSRVSSVKVSAETGKQTQRGVKLAADSSQYEQSINKQLLPKVEGLSKDSINRGKIISEIVEITTSKKTDTTTATTLPDDIFSSITPTEQPSLLSTLSATQRKLINPIEAYGGSFSHPYFTLPKFMRRLGDVDLHASTYGKAEKQINYITPKLKADPGRLFYSVTNPDTKSAKTFIKDKTGKSEKIIEILNPEEKDKLGISQSIEGDTLFGKKIPTKTYKVTEGKTYGRQRQIMKKGESLYSIQETEQGKVLAPVSFRKKDIADFYGLAKSAQEVEFQKGSREYERLDVLLSKFKKDSKENLDFDIDEYIKKNSIKSKVKSDTPDDVELTVQQSTIQKAGGQSLSVGAKSTVSLSSGIKSLSPGTIPRSNTSVSINRTVRPPRSISSIPSNKAKSIIPKKVQSIAQPKVKSISSSINGKSLSITAQFGKSTASLSLGKSATTPKSGRGGGSQTSARFSMTSRQLTSSAAKEKVIAPIFLLTKDNTKKTKAFRDRDHNFLGNTRVAEVSGFRTKKTDLTVGDKKTKKLYREDLLKTSRNYKKSDRSNSKSLLGKPTKTLLGI